MKYGILYSSPIGQLLIVEENQTIVELRFHPSMDDVILEDRPLLLQAKQELDEYFHKQRTEFTVPLSYASSPFYQTVYQQMRQIPYGKVMSYRELAKRSGNERGARAVGNACHRNPLPIFIPCHRVVSSQGMGGYALGLEMKQWLLHLEDFSF